MHRVLDATARSQINHTPRLRFLDQIEMDFYNRLIRTATTTVYCCFTFETPVDQQNAFTALRSMIKLWSRYYRENIAWIAALERTLSGCSNFAIRPHFHCILLSNAPRSPSNIEKSWCRYFGNSQCEKYDRAQICIGYILKMMISDQCEWEVSHNLSLFNPLRPAKNSRERRVFARQAERDKGRQ